MGKRKDNKIRIRFVGSNAEAVSGSSILIEYTDKENEISTILVECGLNQEGNTVLQNYRNNTKKFEFKPRNLNYVFSCHNHADHIGLIPRLFKENCACNVISPKGSCEIAKAMLMDSANIMYRDATDLTKKYQQSYEPIYSEKDVYMTLEHWDEYECGEKIILDDNVSFRFLSSGHIINAYQLELWVKSGNRTAKIGITSDLGNISLQQYYITPFQKIENANVLIGETTYSDCNRNITQKQRDKDLEKIETIIRQTCIENHGKVLMPVFALQRMQSILTYIYDIFNKDKSFNIPILIDSPLAIKLCNIYEKELTGEDQKKFQEVMSWKNIHKLKEFTDTEEWCRNGNPCVFLSCSGMMQAGRSVYVASKLLPNTRNHIVFCGYSVEGSLAWKLKQKKTKTITIDGRSVNCKCNISNLTSFTSHMQYEDLLKYYSSGNYDKIALVHGNFENKITFGKTLQEEISKKNKSSKVIIVNKTTELLV